MIRKIVTSFLLLTMAYHSKAVDSTKVKPTISEVRVFLNKAQISSSATAYIEPGTTEIVLEDLSSMIDPQSIQVSGKGDFIIMGVKHSMNYLDPLKKSREFQVLEDSIEAIQLRLDILNNTHDVYTKEEQMILANQSIGGKDTGVSPEKLEEMADFFRDRLIEIRSEVLKDNIRIRKTAEKLEKYQNQFNKLNASRNQPSSQIIVTVSNKSPKNATLMIDYVVGNAGWYPLYDLRAKDTKSPVQLMYKAQVYQNTGMDWNNVKLKLSTSNPSIGGAKPVLSPWYLSFYDNRPRPMPAMYMKAKEKKMDSVGGMAEEAEDLKASYSIADYVTVQQTTLAAEFNIAIPYSIPSGGEGQLVDVQSYQLPASYRYGAVPKLDKDAFLIAKVTGWEELNLLSGNANVYFEGTYVGQSYIDLQNTKDTLDLSLGRDTKVTIERKTLKDFTSRKLIGSNRKVEYAYEIIVRNNKKEAIEISIEDQIPVSQDNQIEVEVIDNGGGKYDPATGKLIWDLNVNSTDTKSVQFKYSVKYPKNKTVGGL